MLGQRVVQRVGDLGVGLFQVFRRQQVVADPCDIGQPGLRRLGQRPGERNATIGVAAGALEAAEPARIAGRGVPDLAKKSRYADIACDVPHAHGDPGLLVAIEHCPAMPIIDRREIEQAGRLMVQAAGMPKRDTIALDEFADCRDQRFDQMVAGGQPIRAGKKITLERPCVVGVHDLGRQPAWLLFGEVIARNPADLGRGIEGLAGAAQAERLDDRLLFREVAVACIAGHAEIFRVKAFGRFHHGGCHCLRQVEPLALRHRDRARVRPYRDGDRDADAVEPGDVADASDAHRRHQRADPRQCVCRRDASVRPLPIGFRQPFVKQRRERRYRQRSGETRRAAQPFAPRSPGAGLPGAPFFGCGCAWPRVFTAAPLLAGGFPAGVQWNPAPPSPARITGCSRTPSPPASVALSAMSRCKARNFAGSAMCSAWNPLPPSDR